MKVMTQSQSDQIGSMLQLRKELVALIQWEAEDFQCVRQIEIDAVAHRIVRMAELLKRMREIAERN